MICFAVYAKKYIKDTKGRKFLLLEVTEFGSHPGRMKSLFILFAIPLMIFVVLLCRFGVESNTLTT